MANREKIINWIKKLGLAGFLFFLLKGLVWIYLAYQLGKCN
jgi:hypothetical protein